MSETFLIKHFSPEDAFPLQHIPCMCEFDNDLIRSTMTYGIIPHFTWKKQTTEEWLLTRENAQKHFIVVFDNDSVDATPLGMLSFYLQLDYLESYDQYLSDSLQKTAYVSSFYLRKEARRKGIGALMMDVLERFAKLSKCKFIVLNVHKQNIQANEFYLNRSFRFLETRMWSSLSIKKPRFPHMRMSVPMDIKELPNNIHFRERLKQMLNKEASLFYPLTAQIDAIMVNMYRYLRDNRKSTAVLTIGRNEYAVLRKIPNTRDISIDALLLSERTWNETPALQSVMWRISQYAKRWNADLFTFTVLDYGRIPKLQRCGFTSVFELLVKNI